MRNEAKQIRKTLASTQRAENIEVIVVDGGSQDNTIEIVQSYNFKVMVAVGGRAQQMNVGAAAASGEILLFLHADTLLPPGFDTLVRQVFGADTAAGAFQLQIDSPLWSLRLIELGVNWRSRWLQMPYGDQAIFLRAAVFHQLGGFPQLPIMEDFELMRRLRRRGTIVIVPVPVLTSARRWLRHGVVKTTLLNQIIILSYLLGVSPKRLVRWYRGKNRYHRIL